MRSQVIVALILKWQWMNVFLVVNVVFWIERWIRNTQPFWIMMMMNEPSSLSLSLYVFSLSLYVCSYVFSGTSGSRLVLERVRSNTVTFAVMK